MGYVDIARGTKGWGAQQRARVRGTSGLGNDRPMTVETLEQLLDAFNAHDIDVVMSFFADDCVLEMPRGPDPWRRARVDGATDQRGGRGIESRARASRLHNALEPRAGLRATRSRR